MVEVAKCLKLVAAASMNAEAQAVWLQDAVETLEGIRALEIAEVSLEVRRKVKRVADIVPEIIKLVDEKRKARNRPERPVSQFFKVREILEKAQQMRADAKTQRAVEEAWAWERNALIEAGQRVAPIEKPLSAREIAAMPAHIRQFGVQSGFLKRDGERVVEVSDPEETDAIRERNRRSAPQLMDSGR